MHSPEFEFEKLTENVVSSVTSFELEYLIAQDNDFGTWRAYGNRFWPAKYLVDQDGTVRYVHFGEGAYDETEMKVRELLSETGASVMFRRLRFAIRRGYRRPTAEISGGSD